MLYQPPRLLFNAHLETIYPSVFRRVTLPPYRRERITTPDDDFLDLDWLTQPGNDQLVIISHGLEGSASRPYVKGLARACFPQYDVLAWNFRGCSEEINRQLRFYHSGATEDLDTVVQHALQQGYRAIYLAGFSLGGNLTLKYLGERTPDARIQCAIAFSVPLDLHASCLKIGQPANRIYANRFLRNLKQKVYRKHALYPTLDVRGLSAISTLQDFDDAYTAPLHGYRDAVDYYTRCSSLYFLQQITIPTLILNALNDPFLSDTCFPQAMLQGHPQVRLETPRRGGHVGFAQRHPQGLYWSEEQALNFIATHRQDSQGF